MLSVNKFFSFGSQSSDRSSPLEEGKTAGFFLRLLSNGFSFPDIEGKDERNKASAVRMCVVLREERAKGDALRKIEKARGRLKRIGSSKNPQSPNLRDEDLIARTVMRYPSQETRGILCVIHNKMQLNFGDWELKEFAWLLGDSSNYSRGGFLNANRLLEFLKQDPKSIPVSRLVAGLHTVLTAIVSRQKGREIGSTREPLSDLSKRRINAVFAPMARCYYTFSDYEISYPDARFCCLRDRVDKLITESRLNPDNFFESLPIREEISDGSDMEDQLPSPKRLPLLSFSHKCPRSGFQTWASLAKESEVPLRASISGSCLRSLATIEWLMEKPVGKLDERTLYLLAGALIVPSYFRGDYHSIAETSAAVHHYVTTRYPGGQVRAPLCPYDAFEKGLQLMADAADPKYKDDITTLILAIMSKKQKLEYRQELKRV